MYLQHESAPVHAVAACIYRLHSVPSSSALQPTHLTQDHETSLGRRVVPLTQGGLWPLDAGDVPRVPGDGRELGTDVRFCNTWGMSSVIRWKGVEIYVPTDWHLGFEE